MVAVRESKNKGIVAWRSRNAALLLLALPMLGCQRSLCRRQRWRSMVLLLLVPICGRLCAAVGGRAGRVAVAAAAAAVIGDGALRRPGSPLGDDHAAGHRLQSQLFAQAVVQLREELQGQFGVGWGGEGGPGVVKCVSGSGPQWAGQPCWLRQQRTVLKKSTRLALDAVKRLLQTLQLLGCVLHPGREHCFVW